MGDALEPGRTWAYKPTGGVRTAKVVRAQGLRVLMDEDGRHITLALKTLLREWKPLARLVEGCVRCDTDMHDCPGCGLAASHDEPVCPVCRQDVRDE